MILVGRVFIIAWIVLLEHLFIYLYTLDDLTSLFDQLEDDVNEIITHEKQIKKSLKTHRRGTDFFTQQFLITFVTLFIPAFLGIRYSVVGDLLTKLKLCSKNIVASNIV